MLKKAILSVLAVVCMVFAAGCACEHVWIDATYSAPKTCEICGKTEGEALVRTDFSCDAVFDSPANDKVVKYIESITPEGTAPTHSYDEKDRL